MDTAHRVGKTQIRIRRLWSVYGAARKPPDGKPDSISRIHNGEHSNIECRDQPLLRRCTAQDFMGGFDGFENVAESDVPKVVDTLHLGDRNEFDSRFQFRHNIRS